MATAMIMTPEDLFCTEDMFLEEDLEDLSVRNNNNNNNPHQRSRFPVSIGLQSWFKQYGGVEN